MVLWHFSSWQVWRHEIFLNAHLGPAHFCRFFCKCCIFRVDLADDWWCNVVYRWPHCLKFFHIWDKPLVLPEVVQVQPRHRDHLDQGLDGCLDRCHHRRRRPQQNILEVCSALTFKDNLTSFFFRIVYLVSWRHFLSWLVISHVSVLNGYLWFENFWKYVDRRCT